MTYREQDAEKVAAYLRVLSTFPKEKLAYVDETGIDTFLYREHGWSKIGVPIPGEISGKKYRRVGVVAAQMNGQIVAPMQYDHMMNSSLFEAWFEHMLLPSLLTGTVIVMDNAAFHRKSRLGELANSFGCILLFLPPYSPELNPIEHFWSWLKRFLRKILPSCQDFDDALCSAFQVV